MRPELIPLLVVALLMLSAGGGEVDRVETYFGLRRFEPVRLPE